MYYLLFVRFSLFSIAKVGKDLYEIQNLVESDSSSLLPTEISC